MALSESEPLLLPSRGPASAFPAASASGDITGAPPPSRQQQQQARRAAGGGGGGSNRGQNGDEEAANGGTGRRRWKGHLLFPCGSSYESLGVLCAIGACFPCPVLWPCVFSHSHGRLLAPGRDRAATRLATFALFSLFVFVPWVILRIPLSVARAQACAPLADGGGRGIPRSTVVECLRFVKLDDVAFWVSVGLTAAALVAAGLLRFAVRRRLRIEGGGCCCCSCCCGGGGGRGNAAAAAKGGTKGEEGSSSSPFPSLVAAGSWLLADVLAWLLCPACALCQEARTAAAWEREKKEQKAAVAAGANGGDEADEEAPSLLLPLEAPAVPPSFDRGGGEGAV